MDNNTPDNFFTLFLNTATNHLQKTQKLMFSQDLGNTSVIDELYRHSHSLKGEFGAMGYLKSAQLCHLLELIYLSVKTGATTLSPAYASLLQNSVTQLEQSLKNIAETRTEIDLTNWTQELMKQSGVKVPEEKTL